MTQYNIFHKIGNEIDEISKITRDYKDKGRDKNSLIIKCMEELGEISAAHLSETGKRFKEAPETSLDETVDLLICVLSLYFVSGGSKEHFEGKCREKLDIFYKKMDKWKKT